jgi:hypothetical protein
VNARAACAALCGVACASCAPQGLQGSLSIIMDLTYKTSDLTIVSGDASLRFLRPDNAANDVADAGAIGEDLVFKVVTQLTGNQVLAGEIFDLSQQLPNGTQRGEISRAVLNDPITFFPPVQRGEFVIYGTPVANHSVNGYVSVTFIDAVDGGLTDEASGRTVFGSFSTQVLQVSQ